MGVEIDIVYQGELRCQATHGPSKNTVITDAPVDNGGQGAAFSPTDLVATATGTCMLTIMGLVARRSRLDLNGTRVHVVKEMTADPVRRIGTLTVKITLPAGRTFSAEDRAKLERAAMTCPVKQSLHPDVKVSVEFQ
jgi:putative redox protein